MTRINRYLSTSSTVSSKSISQAAKEGSGVLNLSIGEPAFGPPEFVLQDLGAIYLQPSGYVATLKRYENSRGCLHLRHAISDWYMRRYGLTVDPEREVVITHGGIEALNVALLSLTDPGDRIAISDPGYSLYSRIIEVLGRCVVPIPRASTRTHTFTQDRRQSKFQKCQVVLINSPENPTGYVLNDDDWTSVALSVESSDAWVVHDEVYDTLSYTRQHKPARSISALGERSVLVNSFSKKFGVPGLRVGWIIAPAHVIDVAVKVHEALCLGVSELAERVALRLIAHPEADKWCSKQRSDMSELTDAALGILGSEAGFRWPIVPMGGMFLFPDVTEVYRRLPEGACVGADDAGSAVARYMLERAKVAVVPGAVYGAAGRDHIRISNCRNSELLLNAVRRMSAAARLHSVDHFE